MTVTNPYYEFTPTFVPNTKARSNEVNTQYQAIQNAFDALPGTLDALITDTAIFAPESGSGNAYVVTMPDTRTSNQDGDGIRFFATHTNTGAPTLNVDGIGAVALVNWDGTVLTGSEIVLGRLYEVRYDATGTQFVLAATTDAALQVTYAEEWATKPEDVLISVSAGGDGVTDFSSFHWAQKSLASAVGGVINTDIVTATPPTTEAVTGSYQIFDAIAQGDDLLASFGFSGSNNLRIKNHMHGGELFVFGEDVGGIERFLINANPDGAVSLYYAGASRFQAQSGGTVRVLGNIVTATPPTTEAITAQYNIFDSDNTDPLGTFGFGASNILKVKNLMHGGAISLIGEDAAGVERNIFSGDPDGAADIFRAGVKRLGTRNSGQIGLFADGNTSTEDCRMLFLQSDSTVKGSVGYVVGAQLRLRNSLVSGSIILQATDSGSALRTLLEGDPDTTVDLYNPADNVIRMQMQSGGTVRLLGDIVTATPPTTEAITARLNLYDADNTDQLGFIGYLGNNILQLHNRMHGGGIFLEAEDNSGANQTLISGDPDGGANLFFAGIQRVVTASGGALEIRSDGNTDGETRALRLSHQDGTDRAFLGNSAGATLLLRNQIHGAQLELSGERASDGATRIMLLADPDTTVDLYNPADNVIRMQMQAGGTVRLLGDIVTATPPTTEAITALMKFHDADNTDELGAIGFQANNILRFTNRMHGGEIELRAEDAAGVIRTLFRADGDGGSTLYDLGVVRAATHPTGWRTFADINTATPPTTEAVNGIYQIMDLAGDDELGRIGFAGDNRLQVQNFMHGGAVRLSGQDTGGTTQTIFNGDPDGQALIYYAGIERLIAASGGQVAVRSDGDTDTEVRRVLFQHQDGTLRGWVGYGNANVLRLRNQIVSAELELRATNSGSTDLLLFRGDPDGSANLFHQGSSRLITQADGVNVLGSVATATPPTTEAVDSKFQLLDSDNSDILCRLGFEGNNNLVLRNTMHGGALSIRGEDTGGTVRVIFDGDPDASSSMYYNGIQRAVAAVDGKFDIQSDTSTDTELRQLRFQHQDATTRAFMGYETSDQFVIRNVIHGGSVLITAEDVGGTPRTILLGDPDAITTLLADTDLELQVAGGELAFKGFANADTVMFYNNIQRFSTAASGDVAIRSDGNLDTENRRLIFKHQDGTDRGFVGHGANDVFGITNLINGGNVVIDARDAVAAVRTILSGDPDAITILRADTDLELQVAAGELAFKGFANAGTVMFYNNIQRFLADADGRIAVRSDGNTDTEQRRLIFEHQDGTDRGFLGYNAENVLQLRNLINAADVKILANDTGGVGRTILSGDPDAITILRADTDLRLEVAASELALLAVGNASVALYYNNIKRFETRSGGVAAIFSETDTDTEVRQFRFRHQSGAERALIGHEASDLFVIRNEIHGGNLLFTAEDGAGTPRTILDGNPDTLTILRGDTDVQIQVAAGEIAISCITNARVGLRFNDIEKFRTSNETIADAASGAEVLDAGGVFRYVGFNLLPTQAISGGNLTLAQAHNGKIITYDEGTNRSLILNNDGNIPVNAYFAYDVGPSAGVLTGDGGTGVTIRYWNGTGWTTTAAAANMTIGVGAGTIRKTSDTNYVIVGPNLST